MSKILINDDGTANFTIDSEGIATKDTYRGTFTVKCMLSPLEFIKADRLYRQLVGDNVSSAHPTARSNAFALSQLKFRIVKAPPFWQNDELAGGHVENNIIAEVMESAITAEEKYREQKQKEAEELQKILTDKIKKNEIEREEEIKDVKDKK